MVSHHPTRPGGHRYCSSGDMVFSVVEGQDSTCPRFSPSLLFISKGDGLKADGIYTIPITPILFIRA